MRHLKDAARFIDRTGFCFLFPQRGLILKSLWQALKGPLAAFEEWDEEADRMWGWKDELPLRGHAFYGKLLRRKPSLVSLKTLPLFLALAGRTADPDDYEREYREGRLSVEARAVAAWVTEHGPTATATLRKRLPGSKSRIDRALVELQSCLLLTHYGTAERGGSWPSAVVELVARAFPKALEEATNWEPAEARAGLLEVYRDQHPEAGPAQASRVLGWAC